MSGNGDIPNPEAWASGGGDPNFADVVLLLHCDGPNGSTSFPDSSPVHNLVTANANAAVSTTQHVAGTGSLSLPDTAVIWPATSYITVPFAHNGPLDILSDAAGDFTIEGWIFCPNSNPTVGCIVFSYGGNLTFPYVTDFLALEIAPNTATHAVISTSTTPTGWTAVGTSSGTVTLNTWHHFALVRHAAKGTLFFDGVQQGLTSAANWSGYVYQTGAQVLIGTQANTSGAVEPFFLDEIRVTKGLARYTANFTPPTPPFTNF
jgi:hypothetical protein